MAIELRQSGVIHLDLIPKLELNFDKPSSKEAAALSSPSSLEVAVPIKGNCKNVPNGTKCILTWIVKTAKSEYFEGIQAEIMVTGDKFEILINGSQPKVHLIHHGLLGQGKLGFLVDPDFPEAGRILQDPDNSGWTFDNKIDVTITKPTPLKFGSIIKLKPAYTGIFAKAGVEYKLLFEVFEFDDFKAERYEKKRERADYKDRGSGKYYGEDDVYSFEWEDGDDDEIEWAVGFLESSTNTVLFLDDNEKDDFEFGYRLTIEYEHQGHTLTKIFFKDSKGIGAVKRIELGEFKLSLKNKLVKILLVATGRIDNLGDSEDLSVSIALIEKSEINKKVSGAWPAEVKVAKVDKKGEFTCVLSNSIAGPLPKISDVFAVLSLRPVIPSKVLDPKIYKILNFDENIFKGVKDNKFVKKKDATWIGSG